jgi:hypothetical protein
MPVPDEDLKGRLTKFKGTGVTYLEVIALQQANIAAFPSAKHKQAATAAAREIAERIEGKVPLRITGHGWWSDQTAPTCALPE